MIPDELVKDLEVLKTRGFSSQIVEENLRIYIIFKDFSLPESVYNMQKTDLLIFTTTQYPNAGFDMFWVDNGLTLKNGGLPKNAEQTESHLGRQWRRFSYHPYQNKKWNPAEDSVVVFIQHVEQRLKNGD
jgi:uracil DNA glycosylase